VDTINVMIIGIGPHARRFYLPALQKISIDTPVSLKVIVDLKSETPAVERRLVESGYKIDKIDRYYSDGNLTDSGLSPEDETNLDHLLEKHSVGAVILSTDPLAHKAYAMWALKHNLPILMDKPVTARENTSNDLSEAKKIFTDYQELAKAYKKSKSPIFTVNSQRRYHPGYDIVFEKINEIVKRFNCPVTSIQSTHADGQWRMPEEIITQRYHPYNVYGKVSHGGYHFIDTIARLALTSPPSKRATDATIYTSFVRPQGLNYQLNQSDYVNVFGKSYTEASTLTDQVLHEEYKGFGEVDVASIIQFSRDDINICNVSLNLIHNSFSRRSWLKPGDDLYKGNGRVKQEYLSIQQGPFQNIQVHSYQQNDKHDSSTLDDYNIGGNNHFDIYVFRNKDITGDKKPLEIITMKDIARIRAFDTTKYIHEQIKFTAVREFFDYIRGGLAPAQLLSSIESHELTVQLMSLIYQSACKEASVRAKLAVER
jgi:predicted dehydrogenase